MGVVAGAAQRARGEALARDLGLPLLSELPSGDDGICVVIDARGFALQLLAPRPPGPVHVTFDDPALRHRRRGGHNELLGRAVGWRAKRAPRVLDATAGFGHDAFTLADLGCKVILCERQPLMAMLLEAAIGAALGGDDAWLRAVVGRMHLVARDARALAPAELAGVDVIYLDPMFPGGRRGLPAKDMQLLQVLVEDGSHGADDPDGTALLAWARAQSVARVVVKRPRRAAALGGLQPGYSVAGRAVRFDVYPLDAIDRTAQELTPCT